MIAVGYFAMYLSGAFTEVDTDKAGLGGGDAMLEGILSEGNKDERSYFRTAVRSDVYLCFQMCIRDSLYTGFTECSNIVCSN